MATNTGYAYVVDDLKERLRYAKMVRKATLQLIVMKKSLREDLSDDAMGLNDIKERKCKEINPTPHKTLL